MTLGDVVASLATHFGTDVEVIRAQKSTVKGMLVDALSDARAAA